MNDFQEERLITSFKELYDKFPEGTLVKINPPPIAADYLLTTLSGETIGMELTEVYLRRVMLPVRVVRPGMYI